MHRLSSIAEVLFSAGKGQIHNHPKTVQLVALVLSVLLFLVEYTFSIRSNSLLLFSACIAQISIALFFLFLFISSFVTDKLENLRLRLVVTLLSGFALLLSTGYIFFETYIRFTDPINIHTMDALIAAFLACAGNLIIIRLLVPNGLLRIKIGSFRLSLATILVLSVSILTTIVIMFWTDFYILDTVMSFLIGLSIFVWAGFIMLDAYWRLAEVA